MTTRKKPHFYQIKVKGHLDAHWSHWFGDSTMTQDEMGNTILAAPVADQAALHGLLIKVRDLDLELLSVNQVERRGN